MQIVDKYFRENFLIYKIIVMKIICQIQKLRMSFKIYECLLKIDNNDKMVKYDLTTYVPTHMCTFN